MKLKKSHTLTNWHFILMIFCFTQCELNINTNDDCLECNYRNDGRIVSEKLCTSFGTEEDKASMRERMQMTADSLDVELKCITN